MCVVCVAWAVCGVWCVWWLCVAVRGCLELMCVRACLLFLCSSPTRPGPLRRVTDKNPATIIRICACNMSYPSFLRTPKRWAVLPGSAWALALLGRSECHAAITGSQGFFRDRSHVIITETLHMGSSGIKTRGHLLIMAAISKPPRDLLGDSRCTWMHDEVIVVS